MISNLGHNSFKPGSLVRDRDENTDYILESLIAVAGGAGLVLLASTLHGNSIKRYFLQSPEDLSEKFLHIRFNSTEQTPDQVRQTLRRVAEGVTSSNRELEQKLQDPANQIFKDLLHLAAGGEEDFLHKGIFNLAESMVKTTGIIPSRLSIENSLKMLANNSDYTEEFVKDLSKRVHTQVTLISKSKKNLTDLSRMNKDSLIPLFFGAGKAESPANIRRFLDVAAESSGKKREIQFDFMRKLIQPFESKYTPDGLKMQSRYYLDYLGLADTSLGPKQRLAKFLQDHHNLNQKDATILAGRQIIEAEKAEAKGETTPFMRLLWEGLDMNTRAALRLQHGMETRSALSNAPSTHQINRASALGRHIEPTHLLTKKVDMQALQKADSTWIRVFDRATFIDEILGEHITGQAEASADLRKFFADHKMEFVTLSKDDITMITNAKANRSAINLKSLLNSILETHNAMTDSDRVALTNLHGTNHVSASLAPKQKVSLIKFKESPSGDVKHMVLTNNLESVINLSTQPTSTQSVLYHAQLEYEHAGQRHTIIAKGNDINKILDQLSAYEGVEGKITLDAGAVDYHRLQQSNDISEALAFSRSRVKQFTFSTGNRVEMEKNIRESVYYEYTSRNNNARKIFTSKKFYSAEDAFNSGYISTRTAIKQLKTRESSGNVARLFIADAGTSVDQQIALAARFMDPKQVRYILDTETSYVGNKVLVHDVSIQGVGTSRHNFSAVINDAKKAKKLGTPLERANALIEVSEKIKAISAEGGIIATQTGVDFRWMMQTIHELNDSLGTEGTEGMARSKLAGIEKILQGVSDAGRLLDLTVVHQVAGNAAGSTSQTKIGQRYGITKRQTHTAAGDVDDMIKIISNPDYIKDFQRGYTSIAPGKNTGAGMFLDRDGRILAFHSVLETPSANIMHGGVDGIFTIHSHVTDKFGVTTLQATGLMAQRTFSNLHSMGAMMHENPLDGMTVTEVHEAQQKLLGDHEIRSLKRIFSPENKYMFDPLGATDVSGSAMLLAQYKHTRDLFKNTDIKSAYGLALKDRAGKQGLTDVSMLSSSDRREVAELIAHQYTQIHVDNADKQSLIQFADRARHQAAQALLGDPTSETILNNTPLGRFMDSETGKVFYQSATTAIHLNQSSVSDGFSLWLKLKTINEKHFSMDKTAYDPRFSLSLGGMTKSSKIINIADIQNLDKTTGSLAAQVLLAARSEKHNSEAVGVLHQVFGNSKAQELISLSQEYAEQKGVTLYNNPQFLKAAEEIHFISSEDSKFHPLLEAVRKIENHGLMDDSVHALFDAKMGPESSIPLEAQQFGHAMLQRAHDERSKHGGNLSKSLSHVMEREFNSSEENQKLIKQFFGRENQVIFDTGAYTKDLTNLTHQQITDLHKEYMGVVQAHGGAGDEIFHVLREIVNGHGGLKSPEALKAIKDELNDNGIVKALAFEGNSNRQGSTTQPLTEAAIKMNNLKPHTSAGMGGFLRDLEHSASLRNTLPHGGSLDKMAAPLMLVGGMAALMSAFAPNTDDFSQGVESDNHAFGSISRNSEIVGTDWSSRTYHGEEQPFKIDITFKGFVSDRMEHKRLMKNVFNSLSDHIETVQIRNDFREDTANVTPYQASSVLRGL